jgi:hypothetical protein
MRQVQVFTDLIETRTRERLRSLAIAIRHTQGSDDKLWNEFIDGQLGDPEDGRYRRR